MKNIIKQVIKESDFDWVGGIEAKMAKEKYDSCSHFEGRSNQLCHKLSQLRSWLHKDLGLMGVVNDTLESLKTVTDMTEKYQEPLRLLYDTGKYPQIRLVNGVYTHTRLINAGLVLDNNGQYHYVNKLNTNYSDLAEMLTELFIRGGKVDALATQPLMNIKNYLTSIKPVLQRLVNKYFTPEDLKTFVRNTVGLTAIGDEAEDYSSDILQKYGMTQLYQGGDGDFIDMLFGIDLIMDFRGRVITCQVKSREGQLAGARNNGYYKNIDYFISPINGTGSGIIIYNKRGDTFKILDSGEVVQ